MNCIKDIVDSVRAKEIQKAVSGYLRIDAWDLWSDEDDLVLIIDRIVTQDNGELTVHWIDGSNDIFQMERFSPKKHLK